MVRKPSSLPPDSPDRWTDESDRDAIAIMLAWFFENFEDPGERTPFESAEGGFQYVWGGPFNAVDEIYREFGHVYREELIQAAAMTAERSGDYDWAPTPKRIRELEQDALTDDDDDRADDDESVGEDHSGLGRLTDKELKRALIEQVVAVRTALEQVEKHIGIGHNRPPELIEDPPLPWGLSSDLRIAASAIAREVAKERPDLTVVVAKDHVLKQALWTVTRWVAAKADLAVDTAIKAAVPFAVGAVGVSLLSSAQELATALQKAIALVGEFVFRMNLPF